MSIEIRARQFLNCRASIKHYFLSLSQQKPLSAININFCKPLKPLILVDKYNFSPTKV